MMFVPVLAIVASE